MDPEDLETLFAMQKDMVTDTPILLDNGYLLARKTKAVESRIRPLDQVRARIVQTLKQDRAMELAREAARDELKDLLQAQGNSTSASSVEIQTSEPFNRRGFIPGLGSNPELAADLFAAEQGQWLGQAYQVGNTYVLARLSERVPAEQEQWEEQKSTWMSAMNRTRAQVFLEAFLQGLRDKAEIEVVTPEILAYE
jgi:peptidyl-prolyl cis-trans isomerase D